MAKNNILQAGFTIVELLVAMAVGGVMATSASVIIAEQARLSQLGRDTTLANSYVETQVEAARSAGYLNLANGTTDITTDLPSELAPPRNGSLAISDHSSGAKLVAVSITFNNQGQQQTYNYQTLVGELGVGQY